MLNDIFIGKLHPFLRQYLNSSNPNYLWGIVVPHVFLNAPPPPPPPNASNSAQRHADHCVQAARAFCWEQVSLTWIPVGTECWLLINQIREISWCSDLSLCGKNESTFCAANLQVVTRGCHVVISCRNWVWWAPWGLPILVTGLGGVCPTISVKNLGDVIQNYHM